MATLSTLSKNYLLLHALPGHAPPTLPVDSTPLHTHNLLTLTFSSSVQAPILPSVALDITIVTTPLRVSATFPGFTLSLVSDAMLQLWIKPGAATIKGTGKAIVQEEMAGMLKMTGIGPVIVVLDESHGEERGIGTKMVKAVTMAEVLAMGEIQPAATIKVNPSDKAPQKYREDQLLALINTQLDSFRQRKVSSANSRPAVVRNRQRPNLRKPNPHVQRRLAGISGFVYPEWFRTMLRPAQIVTTNMPQLSTNTPNNVDIEKLHGETKGLLTYFEELMAKSDSSMLWRQLRTVQGSSKALGQGLEEVERVRALLDTNEALKKWPILVRVWCADVGGAMGSGSGNQKEKQGNHRLSN